MSIEMNLIMPMNGNQEQIARFKSFVEAHFPDAKLHDFFVEISKEIIDFSRGTLSGRAAFVLDSFVNEPSDFEILIYQRMLKNCEKIAVITLRTAGWTRAQAQVRKTVWQRILKDTQHVYLSMNNSVKPTTLASLKTFMTTRASVPPQLPPPIAPKKFSWKSVTAISLCGLATVALLAFLGRRVLFKPF